MKQIARRELERKKDLGSISLVTHLTIKLRLIYVSIVITKGLCEIDEDGCNGASAAITYFSYLHLKFPSVIAARYRMP